MATRSVNKVILVGNLGRDAETKFTPGGQSVTKFSVATSRRWKDQQSGEWKEETNWSNVTLWRAENLAPYLTKGTKVYVEGRLQTRSYEDKDGKKVYATDVVKAAVAAMRAVIHRTGRFRCRAVRVGAERLRRHLRWTISHKASRTTTYLSRPIL